MAEEFKGCGGAAPLMRRILILLLAAVPVIGVAGGIEAKIPEVAVGPQFGTTHVYVAPEFVDAFVSSFLATFGGKSTKQVVVTVTPTPSSTTSQLLQTPVGTVSLFGFKTPIPYPFGAERTGFLVRDMDVAIKAARATGADVIVAPFADPIGLDAVIQWPGGVNTQIYWHTVAPTYAAFQSIPENRVYVSPERADAFVRSFLGFSRGHVVSDEGRAPGLEIGRSGEFIRKFRIESAFGKLTVFVSNGHLPYPYGRETTGYEVAQMDDTLAKAKAAGVILLGERVSLAGTEHVMVLFPGGYIAEIHSPAH